MKKMRLFVILSFAFIILVNVSNAQQGARETLRDPFWPAGFWPMDKSKPEVITSDTWPTLKLKGVTRTPDGRYVAMIKGVGIAEAGETIEIERFGLVYRWKITSISKRGLASKKLGIRNSKDIKKGKTVKKAK